MRHPRLVLAIFILSGAAGLMYEVVWSRQLVLVFGNTTQAVSTILTGFFGGMAIGSVVGGRYADRVRSPIRVCRQLHRQDLDSDVTTKACVVRAVDLTHAASAEEGDDLVRAEATTGRQGHLT